MTQRSDAAPKSGPTILQVLPELNSGGVERGTLEIAEAIVAAGGRALVASAGGRLVSRLERLGARHVALPLKSKNPLKMRANARHLESLIRTESVDLVHARSRAPAWSAYWAAKRAHVPFVTTYHGVYNENLPLKRRYNAVMAQGARVIAISHHVAAHISDRHGTPADRIRIIPRGADLALFSVEAVTQARVAGLVAQWGIGDDPRPILMLPGRLTRWKGQTLFLDALAMLKKRRGPEAFLGLIVGGEKGADKQGGGRFETELSRQIAALGLHDCVRMVGHCDDMPAALRIAHVAVSASLDPEAFGRVAVEAQAMGLPVVASSHGGSAETVVDGETGFLFTPGSAEALADALGFALDLPPDRRRAMGEAGAERVIAEYSVASMQRATLAVYEEVLGRAFPHAI